jgi:uncharacterized protein YbaA (DUF1428 family)
VFSWIVYKSRSHRDSRERQGHEGLRGLASMMDPKAMPFDGKRMFWAASRRCWEALLGRAGARGVLLKYR